MKSKTKFLRTLVSLVLLMIAVFSFVNVSYSYFTSATSSEGGIAMGDLSVSFRFIAKGSNPEKIAKDSSITLISETSFIERGVAFNLKIWDEVEEEYYDIEELSIMNNAVSCDCYVRFWIEAYRVVGNVPDTSVNYGKYFFLTRPNTLGSVNNFSRATTEPYCYFIEQALKPEDNLSLGKDMTLKDISPAIPVPIDLLGERIQIRISFEAVQVANKAFESTFKVTEDDAKGYYSKWT